MKKRVLALLMVCTMAATLIAGCGSSSSSSTESTEAEESAAETEEAEESADASEETEIVEIAEPITLKLATAKSPGAVIYETTVYVAEQLEERSGGMITCEVYASGSLLKDSDMQDGIADGIADLGFCGIGFMSGSIPEIGAVALMGVYSDEETYWETMESEGGIYDYLEEKSIEKLGLRILNWIDIGGTNCFMYIGDPIHELEDLDGVRVRVPNTTLASAVEAMGGVPVTMETADTYTAMQSGLVDAVWVGVGSAVANGFQELVTSVTDMCFGYNDSEGIIVSETTYQSWPEDVRNLVDEVCADGYQFSKDYMENYKEEVLTKLATEYDNIEEVYSMTEDELAPLQELIAENQLETFKSDCGEDVYNEVMDIIAKFE
ncbi:MAG: TRAP transporter substrate-binding protein [Lachnospiraceae bacterium]|nr:TRAP transporter substrate-binding protein [Lachnospiraceae bacterium]